MTDTPDISDLVLRNLIDYCRSCGFSASEARQKAGELMDFIEREAQKFARPTAPYPPNTKCACGELIHPDMPSVEVEADGGLFHWNQDGGGHRFDVDPT